MRKLLIGLSVVLGLSIPLFANAQLNTHGGGTGLVNVAQGSIPFGSVFNIRLATSSDLQFTNSASRLTFKYGSSTDTFSVPTLCLTGDVCRTTWPTSGSSGSGAATTSFAATSPIQVTPTSAAITYSILGSSASQAGSISAADWQLLHTATTTFSSPLVYTLSTNAVTCPTCSTNTFAFPFDVTLLNSFATTTDATNTSIWTKGVYFSSSTAQASQFPYASTTAESGTNWLYTNATTTSLSATIASTTNLIISGQTTFSSLITGSARLLDISAAGVVATVGFPLTQANGGTNRGSAFPASMLVAQNGAGNALESTSTPTADHYLATSTTASILPYASSTMHSAVTASSTNLYVSAAPNALALMGVDGLLGKYGGASACGANNFVTTISAIGGTSCGTATISGVNLGSNLNSLSVSTSITGTSYNGSAAVSDWTLNMANSNSWTAKQTFVSASTTNLGASSFFNVPTSASLTFNNNASELSVDTIAASSSLMVGSFPVFATTSVSFMWATSSPSTGTTATDTLTIILGPRGSRFDNMTCRTVGGTSTVAIGNGVSTSTYYQSGPGPVPTPVTLSSNNSFQAWGTFMIGIGNYTANTITTTSCGFGKEYTY